MNNTKLGVALIHNICPICCEKCGESVLLNSRLTEHHAKKVEDLNGKAIGFEVCAACKKIIDGDAVFLVEIDPNQSKTDQNGLVKPENAYRTGRYWAIKREAFSRIFSGVSHTTPYVFIDPEVSEKIGLNNNGYYS